MKWTLFFPASRLISSHISRLGMSLPISAACAALFASSTVVLANNAPTSALLKADALLQIDLNRSAVVERIVKNWRDEISPAQMVSIRSQLMSLRADQLLAANVSGSFDGVLEIVAAHQDAVVGHAHSIRASESTSTASLDRSKAVGEAIRDLVYTPIVPCRFIDTRGAFSPVFAGGAYAAGEIRTYQSTGNCGVPTGAVANAIQITMILPTAAGDIELLPQGGSFGGTVAMVFQPAVYSSVSVIARLNEANGQFSTQIRGPGGNVAMDIVGYFMPANRDGNGLRVNATSGAYADAPRITNGSVANVTSGQGSAVLSGGSSGIGSPQANCVNTVGSNTYGCENRAEGDFTTVAGGVSNRASANFGTVMGGQTNTASAFNSTIVGGQKNTAAGANSVIVGGLLNRTGAVADLSVALGGRTNNALGARSLAGGSSAVTGDSANNPHDGAFVWADKQVTEIPFYSAQANEFAVRATGGFRFVTGINTGTGVATAGVSLPTGAGAFVALSDRQSKTAFSKVDTLDVLKKVLALPITTWQYKAQDKSIRHIGPVSQDFMQAFNVGETEKGISTVDADGVALAAIQGLNAKLSNALKQKDAEINRLNQELAAIKKKLGL